MKVADLYTMKPVSLGVASLMLTDGRSLIEALNTYPGVKIPPGGRCSIQLMLKALDDAKLTTEQSREISALDIDENSIKEGNLPADLTGLSDVGVHGFSQNFAIVVATIVMAIITLAFTTYWGWIVYTEHVKPSHIAMGIVIIPWLLVVWKSQGIISRERRDVISVLLGDQQSQKGVWDKVSDIATAMKNR